MKKKDNINIKLNSIFVIQSLESDDGDTGKLLYDSFIKDYEHQFRSFEGRTFFKELYDKDEFLEYLASIKRKVLAEDTLPIIHIEAHGSVDGNGIVLAKSEDFISWYELGEFFREINIKMQNTLIITMGVCQGINLQTIVEIKLRSPFFALIAPEGDIDKTEILDGFLHFYSFLAFEKELMKAIWKIKEKSKFKLIGPEKFLRFILQQLNNEFGPELLTRELSLGLRQKGVVSNKNKILEKIRNDKERILRSVYINFLMIDLYGAPKGRYPNIEEYLRK